MTKSPRKKPSRVAANSVSTADTIVLGPRLGRLEPDRLANDCSFGSPSGPLLIAGMRWAKVRERNLPVPESPSRTSPRKACIFLPRETRSPGGAGSYQRLPVAPAGAGSVP